MALSSPRADNLRVICDLVFLLSRSDASSSSSFRDIVNAERQKGGNPTWRRTRWYHYNSALRDLGFTAQSGRVLELTSQGRSLAQVVRFGNLERRELTDDEKSFLRRHLLCYWPFRVFLGKFLQSSEVFESYDQLRDEGGVVVLERDPESETEVIIRANGQQEPLPRIRYYEFKWTMKNWCKDLDLIDEIWLEDSMNGIGNRHKRVFFPLKRAPNDLSVDDFRSKIDSLVCTKQYGGEYVRIPLLMYDFCTTHFVSVKDFHKLLSELYREFPKQYRLTKIPSVYIDERPHHINGYTNYPKLGDVYHNLAIIVKEGECRTAKI